MYALDPVSDYPQPPRHPERIEEEDRIEEEEQEQPVEEKEEEEIRDDSLGRRFDVFA